MNIGLKIGDLAPDFKGTAVGGIYGGGQEVKPEKREPHHSANV